jgi:hypothetical protein
MGRAVMQARRKEDSAERRPRLSVVISELRLGESGLGRGRRPSLPAHPLEFDERGVPIDQPPLTVAGRIGRLVTR